MACQEDYQHLVTKILDLYDQISTLESLKPSDDVNNLFTQLVSACIPPNHQLDVSKLCDQVQDKISNLIVRCGQAEGHLESHYSTILGSYSSPLDHLNIFPYFNNYIKLSQLEFTLLSQHISHDPKSIAFVGSGPLPLTSICLASFHLTKSSFHNYDIDSSANSMASSLIKSDPDLSERMFFHTADIMKVNDELKAYDVVFLAALVGMNKAEKTKIIDHLSKNMAPGAILMLRSAHGARAFLYPVVDPCDLDGFETLSVFHPTDEVINSVVIAKRVSNMVDSICSVDQDHLAPMVLPICKCSDYQVFNPLNHGNRIEELAIINEEQC